MYHVELRQFPHNFCRFNMSEEELRQGLLDAWTRQQPVEFGERRWDPREASLTVLEGPRLALPDLAMGRGWRNAQRQGADVTAAVLAEAARSVARSGTGGRPSRAPGPSPRSATGAGPDTGSHSADRDPTALATELLPLLGEDPLVLLRAWKLARERHPDRSASECLALAEQLVRG